MTKIIDRHPFYFSLKGGSCEVVVSKSRFIGFSYPINSEQDASGFLKDLGKKYHDSTHICYAYICGENGEYSRFSDDGEPSGTAGLPLLNLLKNKKMNNVLLAVVRYFGGTKLGVGGLARAYSSCGQNTLENSKLVKIIKSYIYTVKIDFTYFNQCVTILNSEHVKTLSSDFTDKAVLCIAVVGDYDIEKALLDKTSGNIEILKTDCRFIEWN